MEILSSKAGTLAMKFSGRLAVADVSKSLDLIEDALAKSGDIHLSVEVDRLEGVEAQVVTSDLSRGLRLLGKLDRFGRVAIVSDQTWIRGLAKVESAILPGVSYRTYQLAERDQALAWVEGRVELPYGQALRLIETDRPEVLGIEMDGRLSKEEIGRISRELNAALQSREITSVLVRIRTFGGFDPSIAFDGEYLRMKLGFLHQLKRYAVVGGPKWIRQWVQFMGPLVRIETRHFALEDEAAAWDWLEAMPVSSTVPA